MRDLEHDCEWGQRSPSPALEQAELLRVGWILGPYRSRLSPDKFGEPGKIGLDRRAQGGSVKGRGRMIHGDNYSIPNSLRLTMNCRDARVRKEPGHRKAAQGYDSFRIEQSDLSLEIL